jgi:hypothetical protein
VDLPLYNLRIWIGGLPSPFYVQALGVGPATPAVLALIGRDILDQCTFLYDGPNRKFTLTF